MTGGPYKNIVADYGPADGLLIIIGAHYDSASSYENDQLTYTPGADDNASGVAGLLNWHVCYISKYRGVQLVAYASEEPHFFRSDEMGSAVHAASLEHPVKLMIALEMIGYYDSAPGSQNYPYPAMSWLYPDRGAFIAGGRQNAGYQRRSSGKSGIVVISGFICLFYECPRVYSRY
ncbi:M28 family peptidase [Escherichia coli]